MRARRIGEDPVSVFFFVSPLLNRPCLMVIPKIRYIKQHSSVIARPLRAYPSYATITFRHSPHSKAAEDDTVPSKHKRMAHLISRRALSRRKPGGKRGGSR